IETLCLKSVSIKISDENIVNLVINKNMRFTMATTLDFKNQHVYVGLDISKTSWKVSIFTEFVEHKTFTQPPSVEVLVNYLKRNFPSANYHCVYEAGRWGFWIFDQLKEQSIDCIVVNPADVPTTNKETSYKTDRVDARKLARHLRSGLLNPIYTPERSACENRTLLRTRQLLVNKQTRCKNQIKAFLSFYGIGIPDNLDEFHWSGKFINWLSNLSLECESGNYSFRALLDELLYLRQSIAKLTSQIRSLALEEPYREHVRNLTTIPGISTLTAMTFLTELITLDRFKTLDQLASYVGLIPGEHSSGDTNITTGITRRQNAILRSSLIESAWIAARKDPALLMTFSSLAKRMPKNKAIIRIARKLLNRIRFVLKNQQPYVMAVVQ
ncbi:MAG: IS110 family transposase, partial [Bacteroidota bacterium]